MEVIWKYTLEEQDVQTIQLPQGAEILCAREQHQNICIWYLCDPTNDTESRTFWIYGTGHEQLMMRGEYIGTCHLADGALILHVFGESR